MDSCNGLQHSGRGFFFPGQSLGIEEPDFLLRNLHFHGGGGTQFAVQIDGGLLVAGDPDGIGLQIPGIFAQLFVAAILVLADDEGVDIVDLLIVDDDTLILSEGLLEGFDEEMNEFLKKLLEE